MNAKKLVMLLAVVAIAIGAYVMLGGGDDACNCCNEMVMVDGNEVKNENFDANCDCCEPAAEEPAAEEPAMEEPAMEEPAMEEPAMEEPATEE